MTTSLKPSEILARAADLIEPEGAWTQRACARNAAGDDIEDVDPEEFEPSCFCLFGAVNVAAGNMADTEHYPFQPDDVDIYIRRAIGVGFDLPISRVSEWNDAPERTQAEAVSALRNASELARSEGQ